MSEVKQIHEADFQTDVLGADIPVLVDFFAPWCGPCKALAPALEGVARTYDGRLKVVKVNVDDAQQLAAKYGIRGVPTMMFFKLGKAIDSIVGLPQASVLRAKLDAVAGAPKEGRVQK